MRVERAEWEEVDHRMWNKTGKVNAKLNVYTCSPQEIRVLADPPTSSLISDATLSNDCPTAPLPSNSFLTFIRITTSHIWLERMTDNIGESCVKKR